MLRKVCTACLVHAAIGKFVVFNSCASWSSENQNRTFASGLNIETLRDIVPHKQSRTEPFVRTISKLIDFNGGNKVAFNSFKVGSGIRIFSMIEI